MIIAFRLKSTKTAEQELADYYEQQDLEIDWNQELDGRFTVYMKEHSNE